MTIGRFTYRLTPGPREEIALACKLGPERLGALATELDEQEFTIRRSDIESAIKATLGSEDGAKITVLLFSIASTFRRSGSSPEEVLSAIGQALGGAKNANPDPGAFEAVRPALARLLRNPSISLAAKALDVAYDFERVYIAGRILTSIRPVFDEPRDHIKGCAVVQTLRLEFRAPNGDVSNISVALDVKDIQDLEAECGRALRKAREAAQFVENHHDVDVIVPGEDANE